MIWELIFIFFVILVGSFIQGTTSFGMGLFAMGLLPFILPFKDSSLLVIALLTLGSLSIVLKLYRHIVFRSFIVILTTALGGRILSFFFLDAFGDMDFLKKWLGILLIGIVLYLIFSKNKETSTAMLHPITPVFLGFVGGFIGGAFAVGGPFFVIYFLLLYKDKLSYNANLQTTFFITNLFTVILHMVNGDFHTSLYFGFIVGMIAVILGINIGLRVFGKVSRDWVQRFAMAIIFISGVNLILFS